MERKPPVLTLHQGNASLSFSEHPIETARRLLIDAAEIEPRLASQLRRVASLLPERAPLPQAGPPPVSPEAA